MSTRSVTTIQTTIQQSCNIALSLYRHWDGYPAEAGATLAAVLRNAASLEMAASELLRQAYDHDSPHRPQPDHCYTITTSPEAHGDLEHVYLATFATDAWTVQHYERGSISNGEDYRQWRTTVYTLPDFIAFVNQERARVNQRLARLAAQSGLFKDAEPYGMLDMPDMPASPATERAGVAA